MLATAIMKCVLTIKLIIASCGVKGPDVGSLNLTHAKDIFSPPNKGRHEHTHLADKYNYKCPKIISNKYHPKE